ncbi:TPA: XVIPCD domain-containing protein [Stenotrophomonas maltophilia]|uniref:XVIPCD domain-containing protein n=1 Tax=Stenotrophomonas maltophilia TaxID=40324 RepID=UPI0013106A78|nr:XVIPCD domain-containing protein [Stenotrophomonas maltophilia]MBN5121992.1 AHH domain-containing protein [Stenotrophomonas maltophilia]MBO3005448.1 AHH domain-containing protein [Stenotrophomonas maltophilia]MBP1384336.1 AHH domain-containing protein [Stenotrophomonas maltophilia]MBP1388708.1 AHH domain-containing protein [Stenotrophomonas maltophilia]MCU1010210.1 AHH domain-containing protein [Stenotrophomonas maltophilia]
MPRNGPDFQDHHAIEQRTLARSPLLRMLADSGHFDIHAPENRIFLPADPAFAQTLGITPHSGGPIADYQIGLLQRLRRLEQTSDGVAAFNGDAAAQARISGRVEALRDTVRVGLINGDLYTNAPYGLKPDDIRPQVQSFFFNEARYGQLNAPQLQQLRSFTPIDSGWAGVTHSEHRVVATLRHIQSSPNPLTRGGGAELQRQGLSEAISSAYHGGRLSISSEGVLIVENALGKEAADPLRVPQGQRGFATTSILLGEASTSQLIRSGGLLASGADAVITARRTSQLLEAGNGTAAQSELTHALARNGGGWIGGMATASVIGTSSFVPAAIVAGDALLMSKAFDKGADLLDNRAVYRQTDKADVTWQFDGRNWQRQAVMDSTGDGLGNPAERSVGASYEKARELGAYAHVKAVELALGKAPPPQDPFSIPARDGEGRLDNPNWHRDAQTEQWTRQVKIGVSGANDRGVYETQTASPERASELNREAVQRIENNIANGKAAIAASYLETYAATRASDFVPLVPEAVEQARARPDAVQGSDNQLYQRDEAGQWSHAGQIAQGNMALELELTRAIQQPSLDQFNQTIAALDARPLPSAAEVNQNELRHSYYAAGVALSPAWEQAIALATARTREQHGITGPTLQELGPVAEGNAGASRPITHYQVGQDGVARAVATTSTQELQAAWNEVRTRANEQAPLPDSPELRIAALSAGEQEAYRQALQEANRQGAAQVDAGQAARAAAQAAHGDKPSEQSGNVEARAEEPATAQPIAPAPVAAAPPAVVVTPPPTPAAQDKPAPQQHAEQRDPPRREAEPQPQPHPNSEAPTENRTASQTPEPAGPTQAPTAAPERATPHAATPLAAATQTVPTQRTEQASEPERMAPVPAVAPTPKQNMAVQEVEPVPFKEPLPAEPARDPWPVEQEAAQHVPEPEPAPLDDLQPVTTAVPVPAEPTTPPSPEPAVPGPDEASTANRALQDPTQPGHPDHALYQQIREGVEALDAKHGRSFDEVSERMTASLLVLAKDNDLERVDHVLVSNATREHPAGHTLFVVQGEPSNPAHQRAAMPTELAAQTSVEESLQQFDSVSREAHQRALANQMDQQLEDQRVQHDIQIRAASM